jgi:ribosomal protein S2
MTIFTEREKYPKNFIWKHRKQIAIISLAKTKILEI